jgi:hypothetical protein
MLKIAISMNEAVGQPPPENAKTPTGRNLAEVLAQIELENEDARIWREELQASRKKLPAPGNKWPES